MRSLAVAAALFLAAAPGVSAKAHPEPAPGSTAVATSVEDLSFPPLPASTLPAPRREVLANGMVVMLLEDHELPLVEARALIRTGSRWEPVEQAGLASLTGQVMRSGGTADLASDELDDLLEDRAASIETSIGVSSGSARMSCLAEDFPEILRIFADVLRRPAFEEGKLAVAKNQLEASIARQNDDAQTILRREFRELVYGPDSPYARTPTYASVAAVERQDLLDWHRRHFHPERVVLGLVGDFDGEEALELVERAFGDWLRGPSDERPLRESLEKARSRGVHHAEKTGVTQSYIRLGHLGIRRDNPDYYAVEVLNEVLGGAFSSRLFSRVRSQQGLSYNVFGSVLSDWDHPGLFFMSMSTKTETTAAGIEALLTEARNLTAEPPTEAEVETAREALLNSFVFLADSTREILARKLTYEYYGYPLDWLERYRRGIEAVRIDQVRDAARRYVRPESFTILVVGPAEGTDRPLTDFGTVHAVDLTIPEPVAAVEPVRDR